MCGTSPRTTPNAKSCLTKLFFANAKQRVMQAKWGNAVRINECVSLAANLLILIYWGKGWPQRFYFYVKLFFVNLL
jgi:hypothetical protein